MGLNVFEKIWNAHEVKPLAGGNSLVRFDRVIAHEITTPQGAIEIDEDFGGRLYDPTSIVAINDHVSPAKDTATAVQADVLRQWARKHDLTLYDVGNNGICHVVAPERGHIWPGMTVCCGDSHTGTHGALGTFALGIGTTAQAGAMLAGCLILARQKTILCQANGKLGEWTYAKDLMLAIIRELTFKGGTGAVLIYAGEAVRGLDMAGRMTLANMSIEAGGTSGIVDPDQTTVSYIEGKQFAPKDNFKAHADRWLKNASDADAKYDRTLTLDANKLGPMVTWGTNPGEVVGVNEGIPTDADPKSLDYMGLSKGQSLEGLEMDQAFVGSCTNSRIEDLRVAAAVLKGKTVRIPTIITPGSQMVKRQAEKEGLHDIFQDAGALWTHSSCGPCLGMSMGVIAPKKRCVSSTNRNFPGRMGAGGRVHLASPAVVAASAVTGKITHPAKVM